MLPNFLIIGVGKAGTTAMWHFLRQHPNIYMSSRKEPEFFSMHGQPTDFRGPRDGKSGHLVTERDAYEDLFRGVKTERAIGETSVWYLYLPNAAPAIKQLLPDVKLIAILRDPVERAFSNYLHTATGGLEPLPFREAMHAEERRILDHWSPMFHYKQKGFYFKQISHYLRFFSGDQMKICFFEDFMQNGGALLTDIFNFLGVPPVSVDTRTRINEVRALRSKTFDRISRGNILTQSIKPLLPGSMRRSLRTTVDKLNRKPKPRLSEEDRAEFIKVYRDDILRLSDLLRRDLSNWLEASSGSAGSFSAEPR
jgi:hypothetical protein